MSSHFVFIKYSNKHITILSAHRNKSFKLNQTINTNKISDMFICNTRNDACIQHTLQCNILQEAVFRAKYIVLPRVKLGLTEKHFILFQSLHLNLS